MRMLVVENDAEIQDKWCAAIQPHWPGGIIERVETNQQAIERLDSPYFFPLMLCRADRETILAARERGVQRFVILPCDPVQVIDEINTHFKDVANVKGLDAQVQLRVMHHTLNSLCHGPVTHRQLQWLRQRCTGAHMALACAAIDQLTRYMDQPNHKMTEIKNALHDLSRQVQCGEGAALAPQYA